MDYLLIIVGTCLMAVAVISAFDKAGMVTGGFSGVAIIVKEWTESLVPGGIPLWITNMALNIPLFFLGIEDRRLSVCKKSTGRRVVSFFLVGGAARLYS